MAWFVIFVIIVTPAILVTVGIMTYNSLILRRNKIEQSLIFVDDMIDRRHELVPRLIELTQAKMNYEKSVFRELNELYERATTEDLNHIEKAALDGEIKRVIALVFEASWNYPEIMANKDYRQFQSDWMEAEAEVNYSRKVYTNAAKEYNEALKSIPAQLIGRYMHFRPHAIIGATPTPNPIQA